MEKKKFVLKSEYKPTGDQPLAIKSLSEGIFDGLKNQVLVGVTGSGKTFTMANVIQNVQRPTLTSLLSPPETGGVPQSGEGVDSPFTANPSDCPPETGGRAKRRGWINPSPLTPHRSPLTVNRSPLEATTRLIVPDCTIPFTDGH